MGARRSQLIKVYETVMDSVAAQQRDNVEGQMDFFSMAAASSGAPAPVKEIPLPEIPEYTPEELMTMEKATTGLYLSGHPMDHYREIVRKSGSYLKPGGHLLFEIGYDQAEAVSMLMQTQGYEEIEVIRDLAGLDRVVKGKRKQEELHV